VSKVKNSVNSE